MTLPAAEEGFLRLAIDLADAAVYRGDHPFGACVTATPAAASGGADAADAAAGGQRVVVRAMNSVNTGTDPTGHAEANAVRELALFIARKGAPGDGVAEDHSDLFAPEAPKPVYTLYTSTEPCVMCCGAIYWSFAIDRVVYACPEAGLAKHAGDDFLCPCRDTFARGKRPVRVEGPFLAAEAEVAHARYWPVLFAGTHAAPAAKAPE